MWSGNENHKKQDTTFASHAYPPATSDATGEYACVNFIRYHQFWENWVSRQGILLSKNAPFIEKALMSQNIFSQNLRDWQRNRLYFTSV
jgi:hypothetical protein